MIVSVRLAKNILNMLLQIPHLLPMCIINERSVTIMIEYAGPIFFLMAGYVNPLKNTSSHIGAITIPLMLNKNMDDPSFGKNGKSGLAVQNRGIRILFAANKTIAIITHIAKLNLVV